MIDGSNATLAWLIRLADDATGKSNLYAINAATGTLIGVVERGESAKVRYVFNTNHSASLPGTLARSEGQGPVGDGDVNAAYDGTGATYDYYRATFGRDSYDNAGAALISTVHYQTNYQNAFWNGSQMVYGDGFAALDVTGHELTHAVTEKTAALQYHDQTGALNEATSDIFGEMVERFARGSNDWLIGEDLPIGAIRSMSNPGQYGQPADLAHYVVTCSDNGGVHTNSGIINKAFYNMAQSIGPDAAQRAYYRALTTYFNATTGFEDARAAVIQAAADLYGSGSSQVVGVTNAFNAVGLDGGAQPRTANCICGVQTSLSGSGLRGLQSGGASAGDILDTLYRVRDQLMPNTLAGQHYEGVWYGDTDRIAQLLLDDDGLRADAAKLLQNLQPGLDALVSGDGNTVTMTPELVGQLQGFLAELSQADQNAGGAQLAQSIGTEEQAVGLASLDGLTFDQVLARLNADVTNGSSSSNDATTTP